MLAVWYVKYVFGNKTHYSVQPRHLHYTDVMLYYVWFGLDLGLGLESKPGPWPKVTILFTRRSTHGRDIAQRSSDHGKSVFCRDLRPKQDPYRGNKNWHSQWTNGVRQYVAVYCIVLHCMSSYFRIGLSSVLRPCQHSIGYMGDGSYFCVHDQHIHWFIHSLTLWGPLLPHGKAIETSVPDRVKPVTCNFWHPGTLTLSPRMTNGK